jgi:hypothetical protein
MRASLMLLSLFIATISYGDRPAVIIAWEADPNLPTQLVKAVQQRTLMTLASKSVDNGVYEWKEALGTANAYSLVLFRDMNEAVLLTDKRKPPRCRAVLLSSAAYSLYAPDPNVLDIDEYLSTAIPPFARCLAGIAFSEVPVATHTEGMPTASYIHTYIQADDPSNGWTYQLNFIEQNDVTKTEMQVLLKIASVSARNFIRFQPMWDSSAVMLRDQSRDKVFVIPGKLNPNSEARVLEGTQR